MTQKVVTSDEVVIGLKNCFAICSTFERYVTNLKGHIVEKVQNQPTLLHTCCADINVQCAYSRVDCTVAYLICS
jgi:hypothetical protein